MSDRLLHLSLITRHAVVQRFFCKFMESLRNMGNLQKQWNTIRHAGLNCLINPLNSKRALIPYPYSNTGSTRHCNTHSRLHLSAWLRFQLGGREIDNRRIVNNHLFVSCGWPRLRFFFIASPERVFRDQFGHFRIVVVGINQRDWYRCRSNSDDRTDR